MVTEKQGEKAKSSHGTDSSWKHGTSLAQNAARQGLALDADLGGGFASPGLDRCLPTNVYCWCLQMPPWVPGVGQQVVNQSSCPPSSPLLGAPGQLLLGSDGEHVSFSSPTPNPAASLGLWGGGCPLWQAGSGLHTLPSPRHSCSPCAADREFTFILVTGLFSFS